MLAQYLSSLGATNLRKSKKTSGKAVNSSQVHKGRFHVFSLLECFCIVFQKYMLRKGFMLSQVHNFFLIFHQISSSWSYKIVLIKKSLY